MSKNPRNEPRRGSPPGNRLSIGPSALQEVLVGGAVISAVGAALYNGLKSEPQVCDRCNGTGGVKCFGCEASGIMQSKPVAAQTKRDLLGRSTNPRACNVCKGTGMILCGKCQGSGYVSRM
ncbi:hypothetical protein WJX72_008361 [[Myrmecia] bisecta]|uniref:Uncharacterized protein n=1 Tax=[Myrmecia] bisecta TaxID=41462 RepID=A0AAW1PCV6_9CHLO